LAILPCTRLVILATRRECVCLLERSANVDALSKNGSTALLVAAREGNSSVVEKLLEARAHVEDGGDKGWTPLFVAAGEAHIEVCRVLLAYKADVDGDGDGNYEMSSLLEAKRQGHQDVVELLLEAKANSMDRTHAAHGR